MPGRGSVSVPTGRMARLRVCIAAMVLVLACNGVVAQAPPAVPALSAHVTDLTATLQATQREALEARLVALEQRKGAQLAVLIVPTTQPETIEQFAIRVFDAWKLGRKGVDDGALLLVAKGDRKVRIEVGRGLEGAIPDLIAHRVIDEFLTPRFREGDFNGGIDAAIDALQKLVDGEALPEPYRGNTDSGGGFTDNGKFIAWFWLSLFTAGAFSWLHWPLRLPVVGGISAFVMHLIGVSSPLYILAGIGSALFALWFRNSGRFAGRGGSGGWSGGGGGWSGGSSSGGWGGSSGSSGWSGGGGSSAGGGASGSW